MFQDTHTIGSERKLVQSLAKILNYEAFIKHVVLLLVMMNMNLIRLEVVDPDPAPDPEPRPDPDPMPDQDPTPKS
ncbi:MAG: hypothetical protein ACM3XP_08070 [Nitrososphaerales archaeon]